MDNQLLNQHRKYQEVNRIQNASQLQRAQHFGQSGIASSIYDADSGNAPYVEKTLIDLKFPEPVILTVYLDNANLTLSEYAYFQASFGSDNGIVSCFLDSGIHVLLGDTFRITAKCLRVPGSGKIQSWINFKGFASLTPGAFPSWTEVTY